MKPLALLAAIAVLALTPQAYAGALIANCTLKSNANVKSMPASGDEHLFFGPTDKDIAVEVYDQYGSQWAFIEEHEPEKDAAPVNGWVLRSSLYKCENTKPWKKQ